MMVPLFEICPDLSADGIAFGLRDEEGLPDGDFLLVEYYCDNPDCDCRNVYLYVMTTPPDVKPMAAINYGWESSRYYENLFGDKEKAGQVHGFHLLETKQSEWETAFLEVVRKLMKLRDNDQRIRRHYRLFKRAARRQVGVHEQVVSVKKIGRNDPCPCGSGRKYKMCCGR